MEYPLKKGQRLELDIVRAGDAGSGVAVHEGLTVFVAQTLPGERVRARVTEVQPRYARAQAEEILTPSARRVEPVCPHAGRCGGCSMQFMEYEAHGQALSAQVEQLMRRVGGQQAFAMLPILGMETPWRYRNKAVFRAGSVAGQPRLGFVGRGTHALVPATDCLLQTEEACAAAAAVEGWMRESRVAPYDERARRGVVRHLMVRTNRAGGVMAVLVTAGDALLAKDALVAALRAAVPGLESVVQNVNPRATQEILGRKNRLLFGKERLEDELMGLRFRLSPLSFYQVNRVQTERLYAQALEFAALSGGETVVDAYCGAGTIGLCMARKAGRVVGIEIVPDAVRDAKENAARNGVGNAEFIAGACEDVLPRLVEGGLRPDVAVLDPPRKGCEPAVLEAVARSAPRRIVYVSCNPATLARDAKRLAELGYPLRALRPCDMFPWTGEVECVALIQRTEP